MNSRDTEYDSCWNAAGYEEINESALQRLIVEYSEEIRKNLYEMVRE